MAVKFITLKLIVEEVEPVRPFSEATDDSEIDGEDDGLESAATQSAQASLGAQPPRVDWKPNTISVDTIRNFYSRKGGRPGSRVVLKSGTAYVVLDTHDEILAKIEGSPTN